MLASPEIREGHLEYVLKYLDCSPKWVEAISQTERPVLMDVLILLFTVFSTPLSKTASRTEPLLVLAKLYRQAVFSHRSINFRWRFYSGLARNSMLDLLRRLNGVLRETQWFKRLETVENDGPELALLQTGDHHGIAVDGVMYPPKMKPKFNFQPRRMDMKRYP